MAEPSPEVSNDSPASDQSTVHVESLDKFVQILTTWHGTKVAACRHLLAVPEGSEFEIGEEQLVLSGEALKGFKFGIEMALMQLGELPFVAELEDAPSPG